MEQTAGGVDLGLVLLARARNPEAIASATSMFGDSEDPRIRRVLAEKYAWLSAEPKRRDSGCFQRCGVVRALRGRASGDEMPLLEKALSTIEIIGRFDSATDLRAAALLTLNDVDGRLAAFHATRLLADAHEMSGEPAVTAARLLASRDELLPLYGVAINGGQAEVVAECLRGLTSLPAALVTSLVQRYRQSKDQTVLVGLFDLLLGHKDRAQFADTIASFLDGVQVIDLYRFLVNSIVASRDRALIALLRRPEGPAADSPKGEVLAEALALAPT